MSVFELQNFAATSRQALPFFPIPTRFECNGEVRSGQLQGYLSGPGDFYGDQTVARVTTEDGVEHLVPLDRLLD